MGIAGMAASSSNQSRARQQQRQRLHDPREVLLEHQRAFSACRLFTVEESLVKIHSYLNYSILSLLVDSKTLYRINHDVLTVIEGIHKEREMK
jgi:hypothetical protein